MKLSVVFDGWEDDEFILLKCQCFKLHWLQYSSLNSVLNDKTTVITSLGVNPITSSVVLISLAYRTLY